MITLVIAEVEAASVCATAPDSTSGPQLLLVMESGDSMMKQEPTHEPVSRVKNRKCRTAFWIFLSEDGTNQAVELIVLPHR